MYIRLMNMADEIDVANEQVQLNEQRSIKYAQEQASKPIPKGIGECLWCGEIIKDERRFCNRECSDCYEKWGRQ